MEKRFLNSRDYRRKSRTIFGERAVGVYPLPPQCWVEEKLHKDPHLVHNTELIKTMEAQSETVTFLLPDHALGRRSAYYHTATETAVVCAAAHKAFKQVLEDRAKKELGNPGSVARIDPDSDCPWEVDEKRTASTLFAMKTRLPQYDVTINSTAPRETFPISFDATTDILWLDLPLEAGTEWNVYFESRDDERVAIEFVEAKFDAVCFWCNFAHLSAARKQQIKDWLKYSKLRELVTEFKSGMTSDPNRVSGIIPVTLNTVTWDNVDRYWPSAERLEPFDLEAFRQAFPILEKLYHEMVRARAGREYPLYACLADFKGDTLAFYNNVLSRWQRFQGTYYPAYYSWKYDEAAGGPICYAGQEKNHRHQRDWCDEAKAVANLWPVTTPNLPTLYVIDRGIKLRPGASIPQGAETFQGNGCV
ncbi:hypothetical protein B0I37DRAFT_405519 [Chaetomium sp. MPI-CAGE-AT-0009]|nr:hypothetical protein B0I37DRAFT_405519 [Chaetomium sp. MPI-CAGE-AT-0009]